MNPRSPEPAAASAAGPTAHPLWPLVVILGEIAARVARQQATELAANEDVAGRRPVARPGAQP